MPIIKGKDLPENRAKCGCIVKRYQYHMNPDNDLLYWVVAKRTLDAEEKFSMQFHSHPNFEEYWFIIEGKGQVVIGDETYDVEPGDLVITPRGVPHKIIGDTTFVCCSTRCNSKGIYKDKMEYVAHDEPYRDEPDRAAMPKKGQLIEIDVSGN